MRRTIAEIPVVCLALLVVPGCCSLRPGKTAALEGPPQKFAVLASTTKALEDNEAEQSEFWYDTVLIYCALLHNGYEPDNIFVLYGDGSDFESQEYDTYNPTAQKFACNDLLTSTYAGPGKPVITDYALENSSGLSSKTNLAHVLCCLARGRPAVRRHGKCKCCSWSGSSGGFSCAGIPRLRPEDSLFLWIKGHAETTACQTDLMFNDSYGLSDSELAGMLAELEPLRRTFVMETCRSGGWLDDLQRPDSVVMASAGEPLANPSSYMLNNCMERSLWWTYPEDGDASVVHGRFSYRIALALWGHLLDQNRTSLSTEVDADANGLASAREVYEFARMKVTEENQDPLLDDMHPGIRDPAHVGGCTYPALPRPGAAVEVYSKDHDADDGRVPSAASLNTPDLQISGDQPPYDVCATVRNLGCSDAIDVTVRFYAVHTNGPPGNSTASGGADWGELGQTLVANISPAGSQQTCVKWKPENGGGDYLIIAKLDADGDESTAEVVIGMDNNKTQLAVSVP